MDMILDGFQIPFDSDHFFRDGISMPVYSQKGPGTDLIAAMLISGGLLAHRRRIFCKE